MNFHPLAQLITEHRQCLMVKVLANAVMDSTYYVHNGQVRQPRFLPGRGKIAPKAAV